MFPGMSETVCLQHTWFKGIVLETYGSGNANTEDWCFVVKAINKELHVINVT
jgi:L-asparaginase